MNKPEKKDRDRKEASLPALCPRCIHFAPIKRINCQHYGEHLANYDMPVSFCSGFQDKKK